LKLVLIGDAESPHLLKWARSLAQQPGLQLFAASSRGFSPGWDALLPPERRLALHTQPRHAGGNVAQLGTLPRLGRWLAQVDADWLHAHYLTSHGTLAWLAKRLWRLRAPVVGSAWGSDILVTPTQSRFQAWLIGRVLRACALCTSDSAHMTERMHELGAGEVMTFPFGLESMPAPAGGKEDWLFFTNRGLEPIYRPERVLAVFAAIAALQPQARLVMANDGSLREALAQQVQQLGLQGRVEFVGRLDAESQAQHYARARWFLSLPASDSVSVSVLEAMAHGDVPILSDLPANRELLAAGQQGLILRSADEGDGAALVQRLQAILAQGEGLGAINRDWVARHAMFPADIGRFVQRLKAIQSSA
jgi:glycosyltransferase involved in cell wall biosynthesis